MSKLSKKNVLIVGMARSGTSMTSAIFVNAGYFVADNTAEDLREADEYNPSGYWEASDLIKCNEEIFDLVGFNAGNTWIKQSISDKQADSISTLTPVESHGKVIKNYNQHAPWIWKDPRLCYTLSYWWPLLNPENTSVLLLKREPLEIYKSFLRLKWRTNSQEDKAETLNRIKNHLDYAEKAIKKHNIPHICINYADFEKAPVETTKLINKCFGTNIQASDLGYNRNFNTSNFRGSILKIVDKIGDILPGNLRSVIKKLIPNRLWQLLNPNRQHK